MSKIFSNYTYISKKVKIRLGITTSVSTCPYIINDSVTYNITLFTLPVKRIFYVTLAV